MINEMSFRSIREERGENGSSLSGLIFMCLLVISMVGKSNDQFINYIYLRCSRKFLTQISMNIPVISSNKVYRTQPEKNMNKVLLKVNSKMYRYKTKTFFS